MKNQDLVRSIRAEIAALRQKGHETLSLGNLDAYLEQLENITAGEPNQLDQIALQNARADLDVRLAQYQLAADQGLEMFRSVIAAGQSARQASLLINGGAAAALLAFVGHVVTTPRAKSIVPGLAFPLAWFLEGVLAAAVSSGATYLAQRSWANGKPRLGNISNVAAIVLIIASYATFAAACWAGFELLQSYQP